jgi:2-amino-4-hydroxy-6-hydroxymethyldihydropteridine diphosphokinase
MSELVQIGLSLGSNLGRPPDNIRRALALLAAGGRVQPTRVSTIYRTAPWGYLDQNVFANACALAVTRLAPEALLDEVKSVESRVGRTESFRWGPRLIDVDILFYGDLACDTPSLTIPHRDLFARAFVLIPLAEIAPDLSVAGRSVAAAAAAIGQEGIAVWPELAAGAVSDSR